MAQKFKIVQRKNLGKDKEENPTKFYAQGVNNGKVSFRELCDEISDSCTLTSADIKAVLDRTNHTIDKHLKAGRIVQFGELGNFRFGVGSVGSVTLDDFAPSLIKQPRVVFTPGSMLREARKLTTFERVTPAEVKECDRPHVV